MANYKRAILNFCTVVYLGGNPIPSFLGANPAEYNGLPLGVQSQMVLGECIGPELSQYAVRHICSSARSAGPT